MQNRAEKKRIVCFGDSNTWGFDTSTGGRFPEGIRWTTLFQEYLGEEYQIVEEGLPGRTAVLDDPLLEGMNGSTYLQPCLMSHSPLELVIIMLGTNDAKERFGLTSYNIAQGIAKLSLKAKQLLAGHNGLNSPVLVVVPPPIGPEYAKTPIGKSMGKDCDDKTEHLAGHLTELLQESGIELLDSKGKVPMNRIDYMHLDEEGHELLAKLVFNKVKTILGDG